jgi:hypothetical protein
LDAVTLLRAQVGLAEGALAVPVISQVTQEQAAWRLPGSTANTIGQTIFHFYHTEDRIVHGPAQGKPTVFEGGGWKEKLGVDRETIWTTTTVPDVEQLRAYARAVAADSAAYLQATDGADWAREVQGPGGRMMSLASLLSIGLVIHKMAHCGEIAALLGCQGVKGLPF